ncbi:MAG: aminotransferase class I/II-fold pyridoxal phosphate-dependent enzyme, partial [Porticoccaceae bacterium]
MSSSMDRLLQENLDKRRRQHLYRSRVRVDSACADQLSVNGNTVLNFCSNDYLGLADNKTIAEAFKKGIDEFGTGSGASHLISGHSKAHCDLEQQLAEFTGRPRALLFSSGYMANMGVIGALVGRSDAVLEDYLNHASLLDGGLLSRAKFQRYKHSDCQDLESKLKAS